MSWELTLPLRCGRVVLIDMSSADLMLTLPGHSLLLSPDVHLQGAIVTIQNPADLIP